MRGTGTAEYWMRISSDLALVQRRVGALLDLHETEVDALPITTRIALRRRATRLKAARAEGTGGVDYWVAVAEALGTARAQAVAGLDELAASIEAGDVVPASDLAVSFHAASQLVDLVPVDGTGGAEFWLRTCHDLEEHAEGMADALDALAAGLPEALRDLIAEETAGLRALRVEGTGTAAYWLAYARQLEAAVQVHEAVLIEIAQELASGAPAS